MMNLILLVLSSVVAAASADCEACIDGWCHSKKILIKDFEVSNQMAIDQVNNILYVKINSTKDPIFLEDNPKIQEVQTKNLTAMTVDQSTQVLYAADTQFKLYEHKLGYITVESNLPSFLKLKPRLSDRGIQLEKILFKNGNFYFLTKPWQNNIVMLYAQIPLWYHVKDYSITDFVVDKNDNIYFVANDTVYAINKYNVGRPKAVTCGMKNFVISTDKFGDVYIGDATLNTIYKIDSETDKLVVYVVYQNDSVNRFDFDANNNIVFHDFDERTVNIWKSESIRCNIGKPHLVYDINALPGSKTMSPVSPSPGLPN